MNQSLVDRVLAALQSEGSVQSVGERDRFRKRIGSLHRLAGEFFLLRHHGLL